MKLNFCTLFDTNYLSRGIAMYESLVKQDNDFHLYVIAFDSTTNRVLREMKFERMTIVSLSEFEDEKLLSVKPSRTKTEYCWTCTSSVILYCIKKFNLPGCIYVDADIYFYRSPKELLMEMPNNQHVMITSHRYTRYYDQSKASGTYCVQFMYFDNSEKSIGLLTWWRERCLEWCFNRIEDGKFGDQKYLDHWVADHDFVWELKHLGGGLAPWNVQQYRFDTNFIGREVKSGRTFAPVFYHYHGLKFYQYGKVILAPNTYCISHSVKTIFYQPYIAQLHKAKMFVERYDASIDPHGIQTSSSYLLNKYLKGKFSFINRNFIKRIF